MINEKIFGALEEAKQDYEDYLGRDSEVVHFMQHCINLLREINCCQIGIVEGLSSVIIKQDRLEKRIKTLEQAKTFFPMTGNKHRALLNNCVDDDEAILHGREIEEVKSDGC